MSALLKIGTSGLGENSVIGRRRVPIPAPRTNACVISDIRGFYPLIARLSSGVGRKRRDSVVLVLRGGPDKIVRMAEETIWRGTSSQFKNLGLYILCGLFCWLIVPIFLALARYLQTRNHVYELTSERLKITQGVFSKASSTVELYRVKDIEVRQPFLSRLLGMENIHITTSDISSPFLLFDAIPIAAGLPDKLRNQVEIIRVQKRVREIDLE